jgi:hypothetical protein
MRRLDAQAMLPSMVMAWTKKIKPVPRMAWTRYQSPVPIAKCVHLWDHTAWISPFACLFRLFPEQSTDFVLWHSSRHSLLASHPPSNGVRDATGFARSRRHFLQESSCFASALWLDVLDISRYAFPLILPPVQAVFPLLHYVKIEHGLCCRTLLPSMSSHPSIRGRTGKGIQLESRDVLEQCQTG